MQSAAFMIHVRTGFEDHAINYLEGFINSFNLKDRIKVLTKSKRDIKGNSNGELVPVVPAFQFPGYIAVKVDQIPDEEMDHGSCKMPADVFQVLVNVPYVIKKSLLGVCRFNVMDVLKDIQEESEVHIPIQTERQDTVTNGLFKQIEKARKWLEVKKSKIKGCFFSVPKEFVLKAFQTICPQKLTGKNHNRLNAKVNEVLEVLQQFIALEQSEQGVMQP